MLSSSRTSATRQDTPPDRTLPSPGSPVPLEREPYRRVTQGIERPQECELSQVNAIATVGHPERTAQVMGKCTRLHD